MDNEDRADLATLALNAFMNDAYTVAGETARTALGDLLVDLRHLADRLGLNWQLLMIGVASNYKAETEEAAPAVSQPQEDDDPPHYAAN